MKTTPKHAGHKMVAMGTSLLPKHYILKKTAYSLSNVV